MQKHIAKHSVDRWAADFVNELETIIKKNEEISSERLDQDTFTKIHEDYLSSKKRLLILDYDGTLSGFKSRPEDAFPTDELIELLKKLIADKKNKIVISSGRDHLTLEKWFGKLPLTMAAEHGAYYKENGKWYDNLPLERPWNDEITTILQQFVDKTPRSKLEEKETALVWHYRNVDAWLATIREQQLLDALIGPCSRQNLQIMRGNKILEIKSPLHSKGSEVRRLLDMENNYDFILAMGDDTTDEDTFRELPTSAYTIKIGNLSEIARFNLRSQSGVLPFLTQLAQ